MSRYRLKISMSLDGFVAGPDRSVDDPLGLGGERRHRWAFPLAAWRALHGFEGGEVNESTRVDEESLAGGAAAARRHLVAGPVSGSAPRRRPAPRASVAGGP